MDKCFSLPSSWVVPDLEAFDGRSLDWNPISGLWKRSGFKWLHFNYSLITYHKWETLVKSMMFGNDVAYSDIIPTIFWSFTPYFSLLHFLSKGIQLNVLLLHIMCCIDKIFTDWCEIKFQSYFELIYTDQKQDLYFYFFCFWFNWNYLHLLF